MLNKEFILLFNHQIEHAPSGLLKLNSDATFDECNGCMGLGVVVSDQEWWHSIFYIWDIFLKKYIYKDLCANIYTSGCTMQPKER